jgi:hypothetical protein
MVTDITEWRRGEFLVSTDRARLDLDVIHGSLRIAIGPKGFQENWSRARLSILCALGFMMRVAAESRVPQMRRELRQPKLDFAEW